MDTEPLTALCIIGGFTVLTYWRRDIVFYIINAPLLIMYGYSLFTTYPTPLYFVISLAVGSTGFYSAYKAIENLFKKRSGGG